MSGWQPGPHDQRQPRWEERPSAVPPQFLQRDSYGQPDRYRQQDQGQDRRYGQPEQPRYEPRPQYQASPRRQTGLYVAWGCAAAAAVVAVAGWYTALSERHGGTAASATAAAAPAQPDTEAGIRSAATSFYAFYSASQWDQAWDGLAPSVQAAVPEATWSAVHAACPGGSAGIARVIKSITVSGTTAVVAETDSGALGKLGTVSDAWTYAGSRWGIALPASSTAVYQHGSVKADVAAAKKAGECS